MIEAFLANFSSIAIPSFASHKTRQGLQSNFSSIYIKWGGKVFDKEKHCAKEKLILSINALHFYALFFYFFI